MERRKEEEKRRRNNSLPSRKHLHVIDHVESQFWNDEQPLLPFVLVIQLYVQDLFLFDASKTLVAQCLLEKKKKKRRRRNNDKIVQD